MKKFVLLAILILLLACTSLFGRSFEIHQSGFYKDGEIYRILSGSLDYPRIPEAYWEDRLIKARAMGLNTITTNVFWNFHEEQEGFFNFTIGRKNIRKFIELAGKQGLNVILRPGPYVSSDWDMGGIPNWLLAKENIRFRSDDKQFFEYTKKYLEALMFAIQGLQYSEGGPIIMMQLENEYGSFGNDKHYMSKIKDIYTEVGITVPVYTSDKAENATLKTGTVKNILPTISFIYNAEQNFKQLKSFNPTITQMAGEFRIGATTHVNDCLRKYTYFPQQLRDLRWMLQNRKSFNIYMFHGGTNFGFWAGANYIKGKYRSVLTSNDFNAPLSEDGTPTIKYKQIRNLLKDYQNIGERVLPEVPKPLKKGRIKTIYFKNSARLISNLPKNAIHSSMPLSQEHYNMRTALIAYKTYLRGQTSGKMVIEAPHDIAYVYLNRKLIKKLNRNDNKFSFNLPKVRQIRRITDEKEPKLELIILVESLGRISCGPELMDRKGITKYVTLNDVNVMDWEVTPIPFTEEYFASLKYQDEPFYFEPSVLAATFSVHQKGDIWLKTGTWENGVIVVNGKVLGRYRKHSPQKELYLPGSWVNEGLNTIYILEMGLENMATLWSR